MTAATKTRRAKTKPAEGMCGHLDARGESCPLEAEFEVAYEYPAGHKFAGSKARGCRFHAGAMLHLDCAQRVTPL